MITKILHYLTFKTTLGVKQEMREIRREKRRAVADKAEIKRQEAAKHVHLGGSEFYANPR